MTNKPIPLSFVTKPELDINLYINLNTFLELKLELGTKILVSFHDNLYQCKQLDYVKPSGMVGKLWISTKKLKDRCIELNPRFLKNLSNPDLSNTIYLYKINEINDLEIISEVSIQLLQQVKVEIDTQLYIKKLINEQEYFYNGSILDIPINLQLTSIKVLTSTPNLIKVNDQVKLNILPYDEFKKDSTAHSPKAESVHDGEVKNMKLLGGLNLQKQTLFELIDRKFNINSHSDVTKPKLLAIKGVLLYGPPGTGKSSLATHLQQQFSNIKFEVCSGPSLLSKFVGESEKNVRDLFSRCRLQGNTVLVIDEIDGLCPCRSINSSEVEHRLVATFLTELDGIATNTFTQNEAKDSNDKDNSKLFVIGTTNRLDSIDPALRRPGRFDLELEVGIPTPIERLDILKSLLVNKANQIDQDTLTKIADLTHGFTGADIQLLINEAGLKAVERTIAAASIDSEQDLKIVNQDLILSLDKVKPSGLRQAQITVPKVYFKDIGGSKAIEQKLNESIQLPLTNPELFRKFNLTPPKGILLYGPPGCSKTLLAKALATTSKLNFLLIQGPQLLGPYVGQSEKAVQEIFERASRNQPCILFIDEIDAITAKREDGNGGGVTQRVLSQFLVEMDGTFNKGQIIVVAATNRPDRMDPALLRPGRFDRLIYVPPPNLEARVEILKIQARNLPFSTDIRFDILAEKTEGCSGAELVQLCQDSAFEALEREDFQGQVEMSDFETVINKGVPRNITKETIAFYEHFANV